MKMKAAVWSEQGTFEIVDNEIDDPDERWVRLRVEACGICGSDLHSYRGTMDRSTGSTPGHGITGTVDAVGEGCTIKPGTAVLLEPVAGCGSCDICTNGNPWHCPRRYFFGGDQPGGFAEYLNVPESALHPIPKGISPRVAVIAEPLAVSLHAVHLAGVTEGDRVMILGGGSIGLLAIPAALEAGADEVFVTARHPAQAEAAKRLGATGVFPDSYSATLQLDKTRIDRVIEAAGGTSSTLVEAVRFARPGGTIAIVGVFEGTPRLPALQVVLKELHLVGVIAYGSNNGDTDYGAALDMLKRCHDDLAPLVTHEFPLAQINHAFDTADDKTTGSIKVVVHP